MTITLLSRNAFARCCAPRLPNRFPERSSVMTDYITKGIDVDMRNIRRE